MKKDDEAQKDSIRQCRVRIARVEIVDKPSIPFVALQTPPADDPWPFAVELKKELHLGKTAFDRLVEENRTLREKYETLKRDYERLEAENEELRAALCEPVTCHL